MEARFLVVLFDVASGYTVLGAYDDKVEADAFIVAYEAEWSARPELFERAPGQSEAGGEA